MDAQLSAAEVTIEKDQTVAVTATNTYTRDMGKFSVKKTATGEGDGKKFAFEYRCVLDGKEVAGELKAIAGGDAVAVE